tara:strand:+ start:462 stop:1025 length:564 start_codon:yes stop_codon:yes gene_type:complete
MTLQKFSVIKQSDWKVSNWSGGTTSELYISPANASFKLGNYDLRLSIATIEDEESVFTPLPGVFRTLTVLSGILELEHKNHHSAILKPYEQDSFLGDWATRSHGKVKDFNVMTKGTAKFNVECIQSSSCTLSIPVNGILFIAEGSIKIGEEIYTENTLIISDSKVDILCLIEKSTRTLLISRENIQS